MPKLKTHSGTKDRIRISRNGKVLRRHSMRSHFLQKKSAARKRKMNGTENVLGKAKNNLKKRLGA